ncbi:MAG TPA: hypothetical protein PKH77_09325 [Anaerolineae bacterium]|nr:hypothetical protein [Anaerolineae bacterium]
MSVKPIDSMPCNFRGQGECAGCALEGRLMCHYDARDTVKFLMAALPLMATAAFGVIQAGYGWYLLLWIAYWLFFFFGWEARVLCSHCPMWAEEGRVLRCHANYGVIKFWKYRPGPMSKAERTQFIAGALIWLGFPLALTLLGGEYLWAAAGTVAAVSGIYNLRVVSCGRCINFSCPLSTVPKAEVDAYLKRNPAMRAAWEAAGWRIE